MYVNLHQLIHGYEKEKSFYRTVKGLGSFENACQRSSVQSIPRDLEISFPYQQTAGFLACRFISAAAFPISQWPRFRITALFLHTVTRSHRPFTCFPFTRSPQIRRWTAPAASILN